ncbi:hypothetical protein [Arachnia rubra]|uniref:Uncharacterized protein n=1 Tax=Arachnia rubra TaxID=1547448 RepID=A0ABX7Y6L1_9ACTN|nr:hypothetical protein [Arachnia rubra]MBB1572367.1 hypothetical protein [Propionibacterium sp.]MDO4646030.1 hypothetical protein [Propionibacteriaceae bacterium]MBB1577324.1 hypothetical protein [Propionibacterium sp.]QUC08509.1 hypothetical protein J5A65_01810 [Arachnia rubra]BCR79900.1 hypothetical protein SK1NUM_03430 [Arachnia rubra]
MGDIEFNREALGVSAKKDWKDSEQFAWIGQFITTLRASGVATDLPVGDNGGVGALRKAAAHFVLTMNSVLQEYSDACAALGSGQETAVSNYDATESQNTDNFRALVARMEG